MYSKSTSNVFMTKRLPASLVPGDHSIEFFGILKNRTVRYTCNGNNHPFIHLPKAYKFQLMQVMINDAGFNAWAAPFNFSPERKLEVFTYFNYGSFDGSPDILNGKLQPCENFRESADCPSLQFDSKEFTMGGAVLNLRDLTIIDMVVRNEPDKVIADALGIARVTLDQYKAKLFRKTGTCTKVDLAVMAFKDQLV